MNDETNESGKEIICVIILNESIDASNGYTKQYTIEDIAKYYPSAPIDNLKNMLEQKAKAYQNTFIEKQKGET